MLFWLLRLSTVKLASIPGMVEMEDIELTPGEYGYRVHPIDWSKMVDIVEKENNLATLSRNFQQPRNRYFIDDNC